MKSILSIFLGLALLNCSAGLMNDVTSARALIEPKSSSKTVGVVEFQETPGVGVVVVYSLEGLSPGKHGFHIHEKGNCSAADATSAGGHWNPGGHHHGANKPMSHAGDLGNIVADSTGKSEGSIETMGFKVSQVIGLAVIVHEKEDDLKTQPTGNSGARLGCGVIKSSF